MSQLEESNQQWLIGLSWWAAVAMAFNFRYHLHRVAQSSVNPLNMGTGTFPLCRGTTSMRSQKRDRNVQLKVSKSHRSLQTSQHFRGKFLFLGDMGSSRSTSSGVMTFCGPRILGVDGMKSWSRLTSPVPCCQASVSVSASHLVSGWQSFPVVPQKKRKDTESNRGDDFCGFLV
jgi:hypothetical protein